MEIDTTNMCSHLKRKLFEEDRLATMIGSHNSQQGSHRYEKSEIEAVEDKNTN